MVLPLGVSLKAVRDGLVLCQNTRRDYKKSTILARLQRRAVVLNNFHVKILHTLLLDTSVDSLDWKDYGVDNIIDTVLNHKHLGNGSIILCHNGAKYTAEALDSLITGLQDKGYEIVPISELIYKDNYHMDVNGRQIEDEKSKE